MKKQKICAGGVDEFYVLEKIKCEACGKRASMRYLGYHFCQECFDKYRDVSHNFINVNRKRKKD